MQRINIKYQLLKDLANNIDSFGGNMKKTIVRLGIVLGALGSIVPSVHAGSIPSGMYSDRYPSGYGLTMKNNILQNGGRVTIVIFPAPEKLEEIYRKRNEAELKNAREIARKLRENYPDWKKGLPDCPCYEGDIKNRDDFSDTFSRIDIKYHPGANKSYRQIKGFKFVNSNNGLPPIKPGQQCTYDREGKLITSGAGAGTPDSHAPGRNDPAYSRSHIKWDTNTFTAFRNSSMLEEYLQTWTPNQGCNCGGERSVLGSVDKPVCVAPTEEKPKKAKVQVRGPIKSAPPGLREGLERIRRGNAK